MSSLQRFISGDYDGDSPSSQNDRRFEDAERHREYVILARENLRQAKKALQSQRQATNDCSRAAEEARLWLQQLEGGWGAPIASLGPATLYEFWLELPGYSGPVRGFSATLSQTGQVQHVSRVSSKTNSGAGCATVGCFLGGCPGAILGAILGKKNNVRTDVDVIDTRRFEILVTGPGVAWSYVGKGSIEDSIRNFRDLLIARSSNLDDPKVLAISQRKVVEVKNRTLDSEQMKLQDAANLLANARSQYESFWSDYETVRLPVHSDLVERWKRSPRLLRTLILLFGPVAAAGWITSIVYSIVAQPSPYRVIGIVTGLLHILVVALFAVYYRIETRLVKTLPSETLVLQSLMRRVGSYSE